MNTMTEAAVLALATVLAIGLAFGMAWAFLQGAFRLMRPATVGSQVPATAGRQTATLEGLQLVRGKRAAARGFALSR